MGGVDTQPRSRLVGLSGSPAWASTRAALAPWLLARVLALAGLAFALWQRRGLAVYGPWANANTLEVWDVVWYRNLAEHGYLSYGPGETRFFPLLPSLIAAGHSLGVPVLPLLTATCWLAGLAFAAALHRLMLAEGADESSARRAAWLIQLVPGANVLLLGYTEALAGLLAVGFFLALRDNRKLIVALPLGVLSGLVRPTGLLLSAPAAVELLTCHVQRRRWTPRNRRAATLRWPLRLLVIAAPVAGTAGFLAWVWYTFGQGLAPYRAQTGDGLRGGVVNFDWHFLFHNSPGGYHWALVLALLAAAGCMLWVCARRLPAAYASWAGLTVAAAVTAYGFHSLPRYLASAFPLVMAAALLCQQRYVWRIVLWTCGAGFVWVAYLGFSPGPVP
jgi:hypothetical protein